jgi:hypothetical protein
MHAFSHSDDRLRAFGLIAVLSVLIAVTANAVAEAVNFGPSWLFSAPTVAAVFGILYGVLDQWAWRWRLLRQTGVVTTPIVDGHYSGLLRSSYDSAVDLAISIDVEQTWTRLVVRLRVTTAQTSESISLAAAVADVGHHQARLTYVYRNAVRPGYAESDMSDHDGTAEVTIDTQTGEATGRYYNYRGRQGTLQLSRAATP